MNGRKALVGALMFVSGVAFFWRLYLCIHYAHTLSGQPQPALGRTIPHYYKGLLVYLTQQEDSMLNFLWWTCLISFLSVCCLAIFYNDFLILNLKNRTDP